MNDPIELPDIAEGEFKNSAFINCIRNNYRHVKKWAKRTNTNCFRIYDRQLHHYPLAIDFMRDAIASIISPNRATATRPADEIVKKRSTRLLKHSFKRIQR